MDVKSKKRKIPSIIIEIKKHTVTAGMFIIFFVATVIGAFMIRGENAVSSLIVSMFKDYHGLIVECSFLNNFSNLLIINLFFVIVLFFLGISAAGAPFVCLLSFIKGAGVGIISAYIYKTYLFKGFLYCIFVFYPQQVLSIVALFIAMNESYVNSKMIFNGLLGYTSINFDMNLYIKRFLFVASIEVASSLLGAVLNTYLTTVFIK